MNRNIIYTALLAAMLMLVSCGEDRTHEYYEITEENQWTYTAMKDSYLWASGIKKPARSSFFASPSKFFASLLAKDDKVSFFTDSVSEGSYGMMFTLMRDPLGEKMGRYYALALFVEPGSPAYAAGIRRGTWISAIGGKALSSSSSKLLQSGEATSVVTKEIDYDDENGRYYWTQGDTLSMPKASDVPGSAIYLDSIYSIRSAKAGYIVCRSMNGVSFAKEVQDIMLSFAAEDVADVIVDLRYCSSGTLANAAVMASTLVPSALAGTPFAVLKGEEESADTVYSFGEPLASLGDKRVFFIIGNCTKGVAELLVESVNQSRGMYDVMTVGARSAGANVLTKEIASPYGFSINPAVAYLCTPDSSVLPASGITPDYALNELEEVKHVYPLGSQQEYILRNVEYIIVNGALPAAQ